jgi:hypothetical protein
MSLKPSRRAVLMAVVAGLLLHTVTVLWVWRSWGYFGRANVMTWMDLPVSITYLHLEGQPFLAASLTAGGLQWAAIAALLTVWVGSTIHKRRAE